MELELVYEMSTPKLLRDIIANMLLILPKVPSQLRCVCKSCSLLIFNPQFIKMHLKVDSWYILTKVTTLFSYPPFLILGIDLPKLTWWMIEILETEYPHLTVHPHLTIH